MSALSTTDIILLLSGLANAVWIMFLYILSQREAAENEISKKKEVVHKKKYSCSEKMKLISNDLFKKLMRTLQQTA